MKVLRNKRFLKIELFVVLVIVVSILSGCGQFDTPNFASSSNVNPTTGDDENSATIQNTYVPPLDEDGHIVINMPITLMGGNTAEEVIEQFKNTEQYNHEGEVAPIQRITDIVANDDGTVNYIFTLEQYEKYKETTYNTGCFKYGYGSFPSIRAAEYTQIDESGIPWEIVVTVDPDEYDSNQPLSSLYATVWPATYLGQYQIFSGVAGDEWAVHVIVKSIETGDILTERDFPSRGE